MASFQLAISQNVTASIAKVRSDSSPENYCFATWDTESSLSITGVGTGTVDDMVSQFPPNDVAYALYRKEFTHELQGEVAPKTTKFIYVSWFPQGVPLKRKMRVGTVEGQIRNAFHPYNCDVGADSQAEINDKVVNDLLLQVTMKNTNIGVARPTEKKEAPKRRTFVGGASSSTQAISFVDGGEEAIAAAIANVRSDEVDCDWCIASFDTSAKPPKLQLKSEGTDPNTFAENLDADTFNFGLVRLYETIDKTTAVKFCFVKSQPEVTKMMVKAKLGLLAGAVANVFGQFHGDVFYDDVTDCKYEDFVKATRKK